MAEHASDHGLAAHESPLTLSNPAHLLAAVGVVVTLAGVAGIAVEAKRARTTVLISLAFAVGVLGAAVASATGDGDGGSGGGGHDHAKQPQYPDVAKASADERAAAERLWKATEAATLKYRDPDVARAAGYRVDIEKRTKRGVLPAALHAPNKAYRNDAATLDPSKPETLVYGRKDGKLVLVGALFSVPKGDDAPDPGGPITRWHTHERNGRTSRQMMHVWFTDDLRSAFARSVPKEIVEKYGVEAPAKRRKP